MYRYVSVCTIMYRYVSVFISMYRYTISIHKYAIHIQITSINIQFHSNTIQTQFKRKIRPILTLPPFSPYNSSTTKQQAENTPDSVFSFA